MRQTKKDWGSIVNISFFGILIVLYSLVMLRFFYRQAIEYQGIYFSDMKAYILETREIGRAHV